MRAARFPFSTARITGFLVLLAAPALVSTAVPTEYRITVNAIDVIRTVDDRHFGLNATIWDSSFANGATTDLLAGAGTRALRLPSGSLSNEYHWATSKSLNSGVAIVEVYEMAP